MAVVALEELRRHHDVVAVLTRPDAPVGRKRTLTPSPVKVAAQAAGIDVIEASRIDAEVAAQIASYAPQAGAVVAYGALLKAHALSIPDLGWFNLHFSLLPQYRGAGPVQWALIDGRETTGLTVFKLDEGMDTGPILSQVEHPMPAGDAGEVLEVFARAGATLLREAMDLLASGTARLVAQTGPASLAPKLSANDAYLDFSRSARELVARARGVSPAPGAWSSMNGKRTKLAGLTEDSAELPAGAIRAEGSRVLVGTGTVAVAVERIQPFGKPMMAASDFVRGNPTARFDLEGQC